MKYKKIIISVFSFVVWVFLMIVGYFTYYFSFASGGSFVGGSIKSFSPEVFGIFFLLVILLPLLISLATFFLLKRHGGG